MHWYDHNNTKDRIKLKDIKEWPGWNTFKELIAENMKRLNA